MSYSALIASCLLAVVTLSISSCRQKPIDVPGCMDANGINYNANATIGDSCIYKNKKYEGSYQVKDTVVLIYNDVSNVRYDTLTSGFTINVKAITRDSLAFDTIITMVAMGVKFSGYFLYEDDCRTFFFSDDRKYRKLSGSGEFSGDTLRYRKNIMPSGSLDGIEIARWGTGMRETI